MAPSTALCFSPIDIGRYDSHDSGGAEGIRRRRLRGGNGSAAYGLRRVKWTRARLFLMKSANLELFCCPLFRFQKNLRKGMLI
jgi:hypothetical protein